MGGNVFAGNPELLHLADPENKMIVSDYSILQDRAHYTLHVLPKIVTFRVAEKRVRIEVSYHDPAEDIVGAVRKAFGIPTDDPIQFRNGDVALLPSWNNLPHNPKGVENDKALEIIVGHPISPQHVQTTTAVDEVCNAIHSCFLLCYT